MAHPSDPELLVLHALRRRALAAADVLEVATELPRSQVDALLESFLSREWVRYRDGTVSGWMLLPAGRVEGEVRVAAELDAAGARASVDASYRQFLALNQPLLEICTRWQLREQEGRQVMNAHDDEAYDRNVVGELRALDDEVQPICRELTSVLDRYQSYGPRLANALAAVNAGDVDWFTKPTIDSYHSVWFEFHEDLLATLGIRRGREESDATPRDAT